MLCRSPVAALTARESLCFWTPSSRSIPSSTRLPKSGPSGPDGAEVGAAPLSDPRLVVASACGATKGVKPPMASIGETLISACSDLEGVGVGVRRVLGHLDGCLVAALGHDELSHLAGHVHGGGADVAVRVGERMVRGVLEHSGGVALGDAGHLDA